MPVRDSSLSPAPVGIAPDHPPLHLLATLCVLMGLGSISTDLYLPALPTMAHALHAPSGAVEWTIGGYLVGFSLGQLLWGPLGDRHGRRGSIAIGLVLFCLGSAGSALSGNVWTMVAWRVVQALGACAGVVLARAMVRDLYPRERAAQMLSTPITVMAVAPLVGPLAGGQILSVGSWRLIFWTMAAVGLLTLVALWTIPETLPAGRRQGPPLSRALAGYRELLADPAVRGYALMGGLFYVGIYAYVAGTPFAYITYYHVPTKLYGVLFAGSIVGIMAANMVNVRFVVRLGSPRLLAWGAVGAAVSGVLAALAGISGWGGLAGLVAPLLVYCTMSGLIVANSLAGALARYPERAGAVSALVGAAHYGIAILGSGLVGWLADGTPRPLGLVMAVGGVGCLACLRMLVPRSLSPSTLAPSPSLQGEL